MTTSRDLILSTIRRSLSVTGTEPTRLDIVQQRLARAPAGLIPARGQLPPAEQVALFVKMAEAVTATVQRVADLDAVPAAVADYLRAHNLPLRARRGADPLLARIPWERQGTIEILEGPSKGDDLVGLSHALAGVAETGTLVLASGPDNPTTLNFLPDSHIVVLEGKDVVGDTETVWERLRSRFGRGKMPRTVNLVTGPSRSADIEQTLLLGAHGPRQLHVVLVG